MEFEAGPLAKATSVVGELGFRARREADGTTMSGRGVVNPLACVPGTDLLRTSVIATWADVITGAVCGGVMGERIPITLDLEVQVHRSPSTGDVVLCEAIPLKAGRTVTVAQARFVEESSGDLVAVSLATFVASPNPDHKFPGGKFPDVDMTGEPLSVALVDRTGIEIVGHGVTRIPHRMGNLNSTGAIQGGMVALVAEEAVGSLVDAPAPLAAMNLRYMRALRVDYGQATALAVGTGAVVEVRDATGSLGTMVTVHR